MLNYCMSTNRRGYNEELVNQFEDSEYIEGVTMYDTELHETFMEYFTTGNIDKKLACERTLSQFQYENFEDAIRNGYRFKLYVDGLPSAVVVRDPVTGEVHNEYDDGIPVGKYFYDSTTDSFKYILYNHFMLTIKEQPIEDSKKVRIVGFEVEPRSYWPGELVTNEYQKHKPLYLDELKQLPTHQQNFDFTYAQFSQLDVETAWSTRMDHYLKIGSEQIHYTAILLSLGLIIGLAILLNFALDNKVKKDLLSIYRNRMANQQRRQSRARLP